MTQRIDDAVMAVERARHNVFVHVAAETWRNIHAKENYGEDNAWGWLKSLGLSIETMNLVSVMVGPNGQSIQTTFNSSLRFLDKDTFQFLLSDVLGVSAAEVQKALAEDEARSLKLHVNTSDTLTARPLPFAL